MLNIPAHMRVLFLLAIGRLRGEDDRYPGRLLPARTVFAETYGQPFPMDGIAKSAFETGHKTECGNNDPGLNNRLSPSWWSQMCQT